MGTFLVDAVITLGSNGSVAKGSGSESQALTVKYTQHVKVAGRALKRAVALGEAQNNDSCISENEIAIARLPFTQAFKDNFTVADPGTDDVVLTSESAQDRLAVALASLGHSGTTLISTPAQVRPKVRDYHYTYLNGMLAPTEVAERVISFLDSKNSQHHWLSDYSPDSIRQQARESSARYKGGKPLSVFDGTPFVVQDCWDALPYETSCGAKFMSKLRPATSDAQSVATLKSLGAILLGKAAMPELGLQQCSSSSSGTPANPHDPARANGGSSSGCAAAVAAGLCPIAIGSDAGGCVGVASSYCGVVGMRTTGGVLGKDTTATLSSTSSLTAPAPIAGSIADALLLCAALAQPKAQTHTLSLPRELLPLEERWAANGDYILAKGQLPLAGVKVGMGSQWFDEITPGVQELLDQAQQRLLELGATVVDVNLPDLKQMQACHLVTLSRETVIDGLQHKWLDDAALRSQLHVNTRMFLCNASKVTDAEYTQAQRMRSHILAGFITTLKECDIILTPATSECAPLLPKQLDTTGVYDMAAASDSARFTLVGSLTGLPTLVMPAGRQWSNSMPVGVQLIGNPWAESTLLHAAAALEQHMLESGRPAFVSRISINPIECPIGAHPVAARRVKELWAVRYHHSNKGPQPSKVASNSSCSNTAACSS